MKDNKTHDLRVSARTARLTASSDGDEDGPPWLFSGIAVAAGDILHMDDGTRVLMTAEELKKAAGSQAGEPLTTDHPTDDDGRPQYPPPTDETVGKVPKAGWIEDAEGVGYEATTHDRNVADGVHGESYEVSVHPRFKLGEFRDDIQAYVGENIEFLDLSVVSKGDSPSNTAEWGPNQALATFTQSVDISEQLTAAPDEMPDDTAGLIERLAQKFGIIGDRGDRRGFIRMRPQTSDGETVRVVEAGFEDARWTVCAHLEGDEFPDVGPGLGPTIGESEAAPAGELVNDEPIELDDPLEEDVDVYAVLHYASEDGERLGPITTADGGYFFDSAFVGVAPEEADVVADVSDSGDGQDSMQTIGAGSSVDDPNTTDMKDRTREQYITFLTANAGFDKEPLEAMDDNVLEQTYELAAENAGSGDGDGGSTDDPNRANSDKTLAEMTVNEAASELGDALKEQGFVTEDNAEDLVAHAQEQQSKAEKVKEIIAHSDQYDDDDREDLMASADKIVDREHDRVTGQSGMGLPGTAGLTASATPSPAGAADDDDEGSIDDYGTGVSE
ncbi:hypothetical protein EL22_00085 [Halostagnicola sp. A56]|uniref:hypothetical protein n=1 Tax=Halostagnicola sp. A56 TaxID=1495067 RepID=UPI00049F88FC|nr:hypothetical protein [Halostagnicola sp. A56]KDE60625.1 hypothetical protein EL22_00085 [Halostagnicola sp. A56]